MQGAQVALKSVSLILAELSVLSYNQGAPLWFEAHAYLESIGFRIFDIVGYHYSSRGHLLQVDVLFLRKCHKLWDSKQTGYANPDKGCPA